MYDTQKSKFTNKSQNNGYLAGRDIFFISTPFQFIIAYLISDQFSLNSEYVISTDYAPSVCQIQQMVDSLAIRRVRRLNYFVYNKGDRFRLFLCNTLRWLFTIRIKQTFLPNDLIFLGMPNFPSHRPLLFSNNDYQLAFFDEGAATISTLKSRYKGNLTFNFSPSNLMNFYTLFYPKRSLFYRITYYSIYPALLGSTFDRIYRIKSHFPDNLIRPKSSVQDIWFIGGPLVDLGLIQAHHHKHMLNELLDCCNKRGFRLIYFKHRSENTTTTVPNGVEIVEQDFPFELFYVLSSKRPLAILSVVSSVIIHMKLFFSDEVPVFYIDPTKNCETKKIKPVHKYALNQLSIESIQIKQFGNFMKRIGAKK